jgi:hypothetical protein
MISYNIIYTPCNLGSVETTYIYGTPKNECRPQNPKTCNQKPHDPIDKAIYPSVKIDKKIQKNHDVMNGKTMEL